MIGWLTTEQAAERLGVTVPVVEAWISRGALTGQRFGDDWWVSTQSVEDVLSFGIGMAPLEEDVVLSDPDVVKGPFTSGVYDPSLAEQD